MSWVIGKVDKRILSLDMWFFDLDNTHTPSPAEKIARAGYGVGILDVPSFIVWGIETLAELGFGTEEGKIKSWNKYVTKFVNTPVKRQGSVQYVNGFYPGVEDFIDALQGDGIYVTRSLQEVADVYARKLGIFAVGDVRDKVSFVDAYLQANPFIQSVGVQGDSEEDGEMARVARAYRKETIAIYVSGTKRIEKGFDIAISRDHSELVSLLKA
jgi:hypothetical protein